MYPNSGGGTNTSGSGGGGGGNNGTHHRQTSSNTYDTTQIFNFNTNIDNSSYNSNSNNNSSNNPSSGNMHHQRTGSGSSFGMSDYGGRPSYSSNNPINNNTNNSNNFTYNSPLQTTKSGIVTGSGGSTSRQQSYGGGGGGGGSNTPNSISMGTNSPSMHRNSSGNTTSMGSIGQRLNHASQAGGYSQNYNSNNNNNSNNNSNSNNTPSNNNTPNTGSNSYNSNYVDSSMVWTPKSSNDFPSSPMVSGGGGGGGSGVHMKSNTNLTGLSTPNTPPPPHGHTIGAGSTTVTAGGATKKKSSSNTSGSAALPPHTPTHGPTPSHSLTSPSTSHDASNHASSSGVDTELKPVRIDLRARKTALEQLLGSPSEQGQYWFMLERYLMSKLSKSELDSFVISALGPMNLHVHNEFILSILQNAFSDELPPKTSVKRSKTSGSAGSSSMANGGVGTGGVGGVSTNGSIIGADGKKSLDGTTLSSKDKKKDKNDKTSSSASKKKKSSHSNQPPLSPESAARKKLESKEKKAARKKRKDLESSGDGTIGGSGKKVGPSKRKSVGGVGKKDDEDISSVAAWLASTSWYKHTTHQPMAHITGPTTFGMIQGSMTASKLQTSLAARTSSSSSSSSSAASLYFHLLSLKSSRGPCSSVSSEYGEGGGRERIVPSLDDDRDHSKSWNVHGMTQRTLGVGVSGRNILGSTMIGNNNNNNTSYPRSITSQQPRPATEGLHQTPKLTFSAANTATLTHTQALLREMYRPRKPMTTTDEEDTRSHTHAPSTITSHLPLTHTSTYATHWNERNYAMGGKRRIRPWDQEEMDIDDDPNDDPDADDDDDSYDEYSFLGHRRPHFDSNAHLTHIDVDDADGGDSDGLDVYERLADHETRTYFASIQSQPIPERELIRKRLYQSAFQSGLNHVSESAITLLHRATEHHLKSLLTSIFDVTRPRIGGMLGRIVTKLIPPEIEPLIIPKYDGNSTTTTTTTNTHSVHAIVAPSSAAPVLATAVSGMMTPSADVVLVPATPIQRPNGAANTTTDTMNPTPAATATGVTPTPTSAATPMELSTSTTSSMPPPSSSSALPPLPTDHVPRLSVLIPSSPSLGSQPSQTSIAIIQNGLTPIPTSNTNTPMQGTDIEPTTTTATRTPIDTDTIAVEPSTLEDRNRILRHALSRFPGKEYTEWDSQPPPAILRVDRLHAKDETYTIVPPLPCLKQPIDTNTIEFVWRPPNPWKQ